MPAHYIPNPLYAGNFPRNIPKQRKKYAFAEKWKAKVMHVYVDRITHNFRQLNLTIWDTRAHGYNLPRVYNIFYVVLFSGISIWMCRFPFFFFFLEHRFPYCFLPTAYTLHLHRNASNLHQWGKKWTSKRKRNGPTLPPFFLLRCRYFE